MTKIYRFLNGIDICISALIFIHVNNSSFLKLNPINRNIFLNYNQDTNIIIQGTGF